MRYKEEAQYIWKKFVPEKGQSDTIQGELMRAVEKLADQAQRNANVNWDLDFERLVNFVEIELC